MSSSGRRRPRRKPRGHLRSAVLAAVVLATGTARAEPSTTAVDEGRARFAKGAALFRADDYHAALVEFNRAYALAPNPRDAFRIQFSIGLTCAELQDYACAVKAFEKFLADGGKEVRPATRATANSELKRLRALVANVRVLVNRAGAEITIDDAAVGTSPLAAPVMLSAGRRKISAAKPPLAPVSTVVDVAGGDALEIKLDFADESAPPRPAPPPPPVDSPNRTPLWIGVGATSLLTIATVTFGVLSLKAKSDFDATVGRFGASPGDVDNARSKVDTLAVVTDIVGGAAVAAAGVTTILFFTTKPSRSQVGVGPRGVTFVRTF